jgi:hypothetical protein
MIEVKKILLLFMIFYSMELSRELLDIQINGKERVLVGGLIGIKEIIRLNYLLLEARINIFLQKK